MQAVISMIATKRTVKQFKFNKLIERVSKIIKSKLDKQKANNKVAYLIPNISTITLNINGLKAAIKTNE